MARPETKVYVKEEIKTRPTLFDSYTKDHIIIATRERFLRWLETVEGEQDKDKVESDEEVVAASEKISARRFSCLLPFPASVRCTVCFC